MLPFEDSQASRREVHNRPTLEAQIPMHCSRDGLVRSSDETSVMEVEANFSWFLFNTTQKVRETSLKHTILILTIQ